ncbi:hypothetical protein [Butyricimonas virosa]
MFVKHAGKYAICHNLILSNARFTSTITALPSFLPFSTGSALSFRRRKFRFNTASVYTVFSGINGPFSHAR